MNKTIRNAIIVLSAVVIIGGVGFGGYTIGSNANTGQNQRTPWGENGPENFGGDMPNGQAGMRGGLGMDFSQYVDAGIIDQETADKMKEYMEEQMQNMPQNRQNSTPSE